MRASATISLDSILSSLSTRSDEGEEKKKEIQAFQLQLQEVQVHLQTLQEQHQTIREKINRYFTELVQITGLSQCPSFHSFSSIVSSSCKVNENMNEDVMEMIQDMQGELWNEIQTARIKLYSPLLSQKTIAYLCDEEKRQSENNNKKDKHGFLGMVVEQFRMNSTTSWKPFEECFYQLLSPYFSVVLCNTYADAKVKLSILIPIDPELPNPFCSLHI